MMERPDLSTPYVAPRDDLERALAGIWQAVLEIGRIGVHDDFFELGGHSLLAIGIAAEIEQRLNLQVPVRDLQDRPTIAGQAGAIARARSDSVATRRPER